MSWSDYGAWDSVETLTMNTLQRPEEVDGVRPVGGCMEALVRAVWERATAYFGGQGECPFLDADWIWTGQLQSIWWAQSWVRQMLIQLIPQYLNHTLSVDGGWHGEAEIGDNWTEETILAELGEDEILMPGPLDTLGAWVLQTYKIINLLRWRKMYMAFGTTPKRVFTVDGSYDFSAGGWPTIEEANAAFAAKIAGAVLLDKGYGFRFEHQSVAYAGGRPWGVGYNLFNTGQTSVYTPRPCGESGRIQYSVDCYLFNETEPSTSVFVALPNAEHANKYNRVATLEEGTHLDEETYYPFLFSDMVYPAVQAPAVGAMRQVWWANNGVHVCKFDGANGFEFLPKT